VAGSLWHVSLLFSQTPVDRPSESDRHSAARLLLAAGEHPNVVAELLGHAKVTQTLETYSHVSPRLLAQTAQRMEELIAPSPPNAVCLGR